MKWLLNILVAVVLCAGSAFGQELEHLKAAKVMKTNLSLFPYTMSNDFMVKDGFFYFNKMTKMTYDKPSYDKDNKWKVTTKFCRPFVAAIKNDTFIGRQEQVVNSDILMHLSLDYIDENNNLYFSGMSHMETVDNFWKPYYFPADDDNIYTPNIMLGEITNIYSAFYLENKEILVGTISKSNKRNIYQIKKVKHMWQISDSLTNVNSDSADVYPFLVHDSLLVFSSNRAGGVGRMDLYYSTKRKGAWGKPINMAMPINTKADDLTIRFTNKYRTEGYLSRRKMNKKKTIQTSTFHYFKTEKYKASIHVFDSVDSTAIPDADVKIVSMKYKGKTNENGHLTIRSPLPAKGAIVVFKEGLSAQCNQNR